MKHVYLYLFLLFSIAFYAQETISCGTDDFEINLNALPPPPGQPTLIDDGAPMVFNIFFHYVKNSAGQFTGLPELPGYGVSEIGILNAVRSLNLSFNPHNIYFKYLGYQIINDPTPNGSYTNLTQIQNLIDEYAHPNAFNYFVVNSFQSFPPGGTPTAFAHTGSTSMFFTKGTFKDGSNASSLALIAHETGHILNLRHAFFGYNNAQNCERVTRDPLNPLYNATTHGDLVADTPAQPDYPCCVQTDCSIPVNDTTHTNYFGETYENISIGNFMSYLLTCNHHFTNGQAQRMRQSVFNNWNYYAPCMNTVESLYQPFEAIGIAGSTVVSIQNNNDGTANVCRNLLMKHRFQPGFTYEFPDSFGEDPLAANVNQVPVIKNNTFNFRVKIQQLSGIHYETVLVNCSKMVICQNEPYVKGMLISTQTLGSTNITVQELNQEQVNNPNLYETLTEQHYHILQKETDHGAVKEEIIYKP